jgi:S-adenosylmethionine decarboxylase
MPAGPRVFLPARGIFPCTAPPLSPCSAALAKGGDHAPQAVCWLEGYGLNALTPLGTVSENPSENQLQSDSAIAEQKDYFVERDGQKFAGLHLLVDLWGARNLTDPVLIDRALREAALAAGATILHSHFHHFAPNGGVSGVVVLAESHISIHTWPERDFAAIDIFMCGCCDPYHSVPVLQAAFQPKSLQVGEQRRGLIG